MKRAPFGFVVFLLVILRLPVQAAMGGDWPQWSGPLRNGTSPAQGVFPPGPIGLREVWRRPVDGGFSSLTIVGGRLFTFASKEGTDYAFALDADSGRELWRITLGPSIASQEWEVASTPASDGRLVFVISADCRLMALAADSGKKAWEHDLSQEYKVWKASVNGCWTSPLLAGNLLIVQVNGEPDKRVMAFDKASGAVVWASPGNARSSRSSPTLATLAGQEQVVVHDINPEEKGGLYGLRVADGALLWNLRFGEGGSYSFDMPVSLSSDRLGVVTWTDFRGVEVHRQGNTLVATPLWSTLDVRAELQPLTIHAVSTDGYVYGFGGDFLVCLEAATGKSMWKEKIYPGSLILVDGNLVVLSQTSGLVRVVVATPQGYRERLRKEIFKPGAPANTPPSFAGGRIFLRNAEHIVALAVKREDPK